MSGFLRMSVEQIHIRQRELVARANIKKIAPELECGFLVEAEAKRLLSVGGGANRTPSTAPAPPHAQRGILRASIKTAKDTNGTVVVGPIEKYGAIHEFGDTLERGGRNFPQRPFMAPALANMTTLFPKQYRGFL